MNKFKQLRKERGLSQADIANTVGVTQTAVSQWETEKSHPDIEILKQLSKFYHVTIDYLLSVTSPSGKTQYDIPIYSEITSPQSFMTSDDISVYEVNENLDNAGQYFGLEISDDSMAPRYINGDRVIFLRQAECNTNEEAVVQLSDEKAVFRKVVKLTGGILLLPLNPDYPPVYLSSKDTCKMKILGITRQIRRNI